MLSTYTYSQWAALFEIQLSAWHICVPSFHGLQIKMREIFSPNPSKNHKSQKTQSRMAACSWSLLLCRRDAAPEGTHGLLPLLLQTSLLPTSLFPSPHQLSHTLENFLISRGQPKAQQAAEAEGRAGFAWVNVFPGSEHCCCSAQNHTLIQDSGSVRQTHPEWIPESQSGLGWKGSYSSSLLPQTGTPSIIPGIPVQPKLGRFQGWSIPNTYLGCAILIFFYYSNNSSI